MSESGKTAPAAPGSRDKNETPDQLPLFASGLAAKRGRTYARPAKPRSRSRTTTKKENRRMSKSSSKKNSSNSKPNSRSSTRNSSSISRRSSSGSSNRKSTDAYEVPRCALQTLGGSSGSGTAGSLNRGMSQAQNSRRASSKSKATLKKMKGYGGKMFYDKCYLSSSNEEGGSDGTPDGDGEMTLPWELSPPEDGGGVDDGNDADDCAPAKAKTKAATASSITTFPKKKALVMVSSSSSVLGNGSSSSRSSKRGGATGGGSGSNRGKVR